MAREAASVAPAVALLTAGLAACGPSAASTATSSPAGAGQSTCAIAEQNTEIPLLKQMMLSAKAV